MLPSITQQSISRVRGGHNVRTYAVFFVGDDNGEENVNAAYNCLRCGVESTNGSELSSSTFDFAASSDVAGVESSEPSASRKIRKLGSGRVLDGVKRDMLDELDAVLNEINEAESK